MSVTGLESTDSRIPQEGVTENPLVEVGKQMVNEVLVKIDGDYGRLSPPIKQSLAEMYAVDWLRQAGNNQDRAMELAQGSRRPIMVPEGIRTSYNDWTIYSNEFVTCLQDFQSRFVHDGQFDRELFLNALALNIMGLPNSNSADRSLFFKSQNLCDLMVMAERIGWVTDHYSNPNTGESYPSFGATRFTRPLYTGAGVTLIKFLGGTDEDYNIMTKLQERTSEKAQDLFLDRTPSYYPPYLHNARDRLSQKKQTFNQQIAPRFLRSIKR